MRLIGTLAQPLAERFADYLLTQGITTRLDQQAAGVDLWVREEERVEQAVAELRQFQAEPDAERYQAAQKAAHSLRSAEAKHRAQTQRNLVEMRRKWDARAAGGRPFTALLVAISAAVFIFTYFGRGNEQAERIEQSRMLIDSAIDAGRLAYAYRPTLPAVQSGEVWRIITPIFVHYTAIHLVFNMLMLLQLGGWIEAAKGTWKLVAMVLLIAAASNLGQFYFRHSPLFGGMSGVDYGLFGYLWMKGRFQPAEGLGLNPTTIFLGLFWFVICFTPAVGPIANWAHSIGLGLGMLLGWLPWVYEQHLRPRPPKL